MLANLIVLFMVLAVAFAADPALPTLPQQYMVEDIAIDMKTNAGYPPHYTETDSVQYYDFIAQKTRLDVKEASYGTKGPFTKVYNYADLFSNNCGGMYEDVKAPRGYLIKSGQCCYVNLIDNCPYRPSSGELPMARSMAAPTLPTKIQYMGTSAGEGVAPAGSDCDLWTSDIYLKQEVPVIHGDYYFDVSDHSTQLGNFMSINAGPQFVNATTTYNGKWTYEPVDEQMFDISDYDCSAQCQDSVSAALKLSGRAHSKNH
jgi:hypothetical protein